MCPITLFFLRVFLNFSSFIQFPAAFSLVFYRIIWFCNTTEEFWLIQWHQAQRSCPTQRRVHSAEGCPSLPRPSILTPLAAGWSCCQFSENSCAVLTNVQYKKLDLERPWMCNSDVSLRWPSVVSILGDVGWSLFPVAGLEVQLELLSGEMAGGDVEKWGWFALVNTVIWWDNSGGQISHIANEIQGILCGDEMRNYYVYSLIKKTLMYSMNKRAFWSISLQHFRLST